MDDRDLVMRTNVIQDPVTKIITSKSTAAPDKVPYDDDMVRVEMTKTEWIVTPLGNNKARIDYRLISDPGGSIPSFLINIASDFGPYKTMAAFRKRVKLPEYREVNIEGIEELQLVEKQD